jgi:hypothetical protein
MEPHVILTSSVRLTPADSSSATASAICRLENNCLTSSGCWNCCCKMQFLYPRRAVSGCFSRSALLHPPTSPLFPSLARSPPRPSRTTKICGEMACQWRIPSSRRDPGLAATSVPCGGGDLWCSPRGHRAVSLLHPPAAMLLHPPVVVLLRTQRWRRPAATAALDPDGGRAQRHRLEALRAEPQRDAADPALATSSRGARPRSRGSEEQGRGSLD